MSNSRDSILQKIRSALKEHKVHKPFPEVGPEPDIYAKSDETPEEKFALEFNKLGGKFIFCSNHDEMIEQLCSLADNLKWNAIQSKDSFLVQLFQDKNLTLVQEASEGMPDIAIGISSCECLVARTGSVILSSGQEYGRALPVYAPIHIAVAYSNQVVWDIKDSIAFLEKKYPKGLPSMISLTTGPSRTADIEKTLVVGVHGPKEVYVFLIDQ